jgi:mannose-6-phosphate isomerase-like protein (cupin superfamily)
MRVLRSGDLQPTAFGGIAIRDLGPLLNDERLSVAHIDAPAGARHGRAYSRRSSKLYVVVTGSVTFDDTVLAPGDIILIQAGERFSYVSGTSGCTMLLLHLPSFRLDEEVFLE